MAQFEANSCPADTKVGKTELEAWHVLLTVINIPGTVYNLQKRPGLPLLFGINTGLEPLVDVHIFLEGHVSDAHEAVLAARGVPSGDYHEYFEINNIPKEGEDARSVKVPIAVVKSKLLFEGRSGQGNFLTLPSVCSGSTTSYLEVESYSGEVSATETHPPVGVAGCDKVPFKPTVAVTPENAGSDQPDGATADVTVHQNVGAEEINTSDINEVHVALPEGMTLNPAAAHGLAACTAAQIGIGTTNPVTCPAASKVGTVTIETDLPPGSLAGNVYLGSPSGGTITEPPYTIYLDAESTLGVSVRLQGSVTPDPSTGRLKATFANNPQLPFSDVILKFNGGPRAPVANPLACGTTSVEASVHAVHRGRCRSELDAVYDDGMSVSAAVLADTEHAELERKRRRLHLLHIQPQPGRRPAVPVAAPDHAAGRPGRRDPVGGAVRRTAGAGGNVRGRQRNRQGDGQRRRRAPNRTHSPVRSI